MEDRALILLLGVMPALVAGIHVFTVSQQGKTWMAGTSPAMTGASWSRGDGED